MVSVRVCRPAVDHQEAPRGSSLSLIHSRRRVVVQENRNAGCQARRPGVSDMLHNLSLPRSIPAAADMWIISARNPPCAATQNGGWAARLDIGRGVSPNRPGTSSLPALADADANGCCLLGSASNLIPRTETSGDELAASYNNVAPVWRRAGGVSSILTARNWELGSCSRLPHGKKGSNGK